MRSGSIIATMTFGTPPVVSSVNKSAITRTQGGILMRVTGSGFTGATACAFGGTNGTSLSVLNDTTIDVVTPAKAAGDHAVVVTGPGGSSNATVTVKFVNPTSIFGANLKRWYSQTYSGGGWTDESATQNTSQATAAKRPSASTFAGTTDRPGTHVALLFDGADDGLNMGGASDIVTTALTIGFIASADPTQGAEANVVAKNYNAEDLIFGIRSTDPDNMLFACGGSTDTEAAISTAAVNDNVVRRYIGTNNGATSTLYVNGTAQPNTGTGAIAGGTLDFNAIGCAMAAEAATDYHFKGKIGEVVEANVVATATQRSHLECYLRDCAGQAA